MRVLIAANIEAQDIYQNFFDRDYTVDICHFDSLQESVRKFTPDVVLLYCGCRVKNCLQALGAIKSDSPSIPVIFLTRISAEHIVIEAFRLGAKDYFKEPFDFEEIRATINNLFRYIKQSTEKRQAAISPASIVTNNLEATLPAKIADIISYMKKNLARDISLDKLAKRAAMSKYHFCRVFKKHTGIPPMLYLTGKRIEQAKILLLDEERSIGEIMTAVGFQDQSNFIKNFKKIEGVTPSIYRRDNLCSPKHQRVGPANQ